MKFIYEKSSINVPENNKKESEVSINFYEGKDYISSTIADGSGGVGAKEASKLVVNNLITISKEDKPNYIEEFYNLNVLVNNAQSTAIILEVNNYGINGVSCGNSKVFLFKKDGKVLELTHMQHKNRIIGNGVIPMPFYNELEEGIILLCNDGLWKNLTIEEIYQITIESNIENALIKMKNKIEKKSKILLDDFSGILISIHKLDI